MTGAAEAGGWPSGPAPGHRPSTPPTAACRSPTTSWPARPAMLAAQRRPRPAAARHGPRRLPILVARWAGPGVRRPGVRGRPLRPARRRAVNPDARHRPRQSVRRARPQAGRVLLRGHDRRRGRGARRARLGAGAHLRRLARRRHRPADRAPPSRPDPQRRLGHGDMPSDAVGIRGGRYVRFGTLARLARVKVPEGRDGDIQLSLALARELATPAYPFDEAAAREWIEREVDAGPRDTKAQSRQVGAPGTARSYPSCASPPSSCTATRTRSCASAPPAPPPRPSRRPPGDPARGRPRPSRPALAGHRPRGPPARRPGIYPLKLTICSGSLAHRWHR